MTLEQYDQLFESQGGVCAICGRIDSDGRRLSVDHDHRAGKVRGLLCGKCNRGIGIFDEDIIKLQSAINYLK